VSRASGSNGIEVGRSSEVLCPGYKVALVSVSGLRDVVNALYASKLCLKSHHAHLK
jgi:hypothetical protein